MRVKLLLQWCILQSITVVTIGSLLSLGYSASNLNGPFPKNMYRPGQAKVDFLFSKKVYFSLPRSVDNNFIDFSQLSR